MLSTDAGNDHRCRGPRTVTSRHHTDYNSGLRQPRPVCPKPHSDNVMGCAFRPPDTPTCARSGHHLIRIDVTGRGRSAGDPPPRQRGRPKRASQRTENRSVVSKMVDREDRNLRLRCLPLSRQSYSVLNGAASCCGRRRIGFRGLLQTIPRRGAWVPPLLVPAEAGSWGPACADRLIAGYGDWLNPEGRVSRSMVLG